MVGDGINDAPALAAADLGIAMGVAGAAVVMETADVALMINDLRKLASAVRLGLDCRWKIGQNVTFNFVTKLLIIGLAAGGCASLWTAVVADVGTCLAVIFNSLRILKKKLVEDDQCISRKLDIELKDCNSRCCEDGENNECSESAIIQGPVATQKQLLAYHHNGFRVRIPWLFKHIQHDQHHDKKEKREEDALRCADKEDQPPCCSSARCEKKGLTSRGKGQRHGNNVGGFDKTKGVRKRSDLCESNCGSDVPAVSSAQPKLPGCGPSRNCCLPEEELGQEAELLHKSRIAGAGARCCAKESCNDLASRVVDAAILKNGSDCCSEGSCTQPEASGPLSSVSAGCCATTNSHVEIEIGMLL